MIFIIFCEVIVFWGLFLVVFFLRYIVFIFCIFEIFVWLSSITIFIVVLCIMGMLYLFWLYIFLLIVFWLREKFCLDFGLFIFIIYKFMFFVFIFNFLWYIIVCFIFFFVFVLRVWLLMEICFRCVISTLELDEFFGIIIIGVFSCVLRIIFVLGFLLKFLNWLVLFNDWLE